MSEDAQWIGGKRPLRNYVNRSSITGLILLVVGILVLLLASTRDSITGQTVYASLGAMIGSAGLVSIIYDALLKSALAEDLMTIVRLSESINAARLTDIKTSGGDFRWSALFARGRAFRILPLDAEAWLRHEWPMLLDAAEVRQVRVRLYLSTRLDSKPAIDPSRTATAIAVDAADQWRRRGTELHRKSKCEIYAFDGPPPSVGYVLGDRNLAIALPSAMGPEADAQTMIAVFDANGRSTAVAWARRTLDNLPGCHKLDGVASRSKAKRQVILPSVSKKSRPTSTEVAVTEADETDEDEHG